jgi:hypothetical protein
MIFMIFFDTCFGIDFDEFWHRFRLHFGSLFELFSMYFRYRFLDESSIYFLWTLDQNGSQKPGMRTPFLAPFSRPFLKIDFYMHFGRPWLPFGSLWLPFGSLLDPFGSLLALFWLAFGSQISERTFWNTFSKAPEDNTTHPDLRSPPSLKARSGTLPLAI